MIYYLIQILVKRNLYVMDDEVKVLPHVFELSLGVDRCIYSILEHSYFIDKEKDDRVLLKLKPYLIPYSSWYFTTFKKGRIQKKIYGTFIISKKRF